jgi:hypothetical protein
MANRQLVVHFPHTWEAIQGQSRAFRRKGENTGQLRLSLCPPIEGNGDGNAVSNRLSTTLLSIGKELGEEIHSSHRLCSLGVMATSIWRSSSQGLQQYWMVESEVSIFASYVMGSLETIEIEMAEAQQIIDGLRFVDATK